MAKINVFTDFLSGIPQEKGSRDMLKAIKAVETLLGDAETVNQRIAYLESLAECASEFPEVCQKSLDDPLNHDQHIKCIEKGLAKAFKDGDITFDQIAGLAHSIDGLNAFSDALVEVPDTQKARCWKKALSVSFETPQINLARIMPIASSETVWQQISGCFNQWMASMAPAKLAPVMGYRGTSAGPARFEPNTALTQGKIMLKQLDNLNKLSGELPDDVILRAWERIPWFQLRKYTSEESTWESFLFKVGVILSTEFSSEEIQMLNNWVINKAGSLIQYKSEIKLFEILLKSVYLVRQ